MWRVQAFDRDGREVATLLAAGGEITIGRETDRRLVLPSPSVSRRHARIVLDGPQPFVVDEGSANGVLVNGVRIGGPTALVAGTRIDIAEFRLEFDAPPAAAPRRAPVPLRLVAEDGTYAGQTFELHPGATSFGRAIDNDLVLDDPSLSRKHGRLMNHGTHVELEDLGSSNGSYVNGRRVPNGAAQTARGGDLLRFGELHFRLEGDRADDAVAWPSAGDAEPARGGVPPVYIYGGVAAFVAVIGVLVVLLFVRAPRPSAAGDSIAEMQAQAAQHLKAGTDKLAAKDFAGAQKEFDRVLEVDPANGDARRLRSVAVSEPQNEQLSKQTKAKIVVASSRADLEAAMRLYGQIPPESLFREATAQKLAGKLVAFGRDQCKAKRFADCAWAICRAWDVAPTEQRASLVPGDADADLRDAEKKLAKDRAYAPCKHH